MTDSGGFVVVSDGPEPITDIKMLSKKENKPPDFEVVSNVSRGRAPLAKYRVNDKNSW